MKPAAASAASPMATSFKFGSSRLLSLAQQLRVYKPPLSSPFDEAEEMRAYKKNTRKLISHVGFQEPMAPLRFIPKKAAVLICLFEGDDGDLRVILTKRSSTLSTHSGEISLPGGKAEENDKDDGITATREAEEEIGLDPSLVDVVAFLEPFLSQHLLRVIPVIGILWDRKAFNPTPNPAEVEAVFDAPFEMFLKDENRRSEEFDWMGEKHLVHFFDYKTGDNDYVIWGLTARILIRAATVVYQRPPAFIEQKAFKYPRMIAEGAEFLLPPCWDILWQFFMNLMITKDRWRCLYLVMSQAYCLHYLVGIFSKREFLCISESFDLKAKLILGKSFSFFFGMNLISEINKFKK